MSNSHITVTARWPHTPIGTSVLVEIPNTYDADEAAQAVNYAVAELRRGTPAARLVRALAAFLSQPAITIKAVFTRG